MKDLLLFAELFFRCWDLLSMQYLFSQIRIELLTFRFLLARFAFYIKAVRLNVHYFAGYTLFQDFIF